MARLRYSLGALLIAITVLSCIMAAFVRAYADQQDVFRASVQTVLFLILLAAVMVFVSSGYEYKFLKNVLFKTDSSHNSEESVNRPQEKRQNDGNGEIADD